MSTWRAGAVSGSLCGAGCGPGLPPKPPSPRSMAAEVMVAIGSPLALSMMVRSA